MIIRHMTSRTGADGPHPVDPIDRAHLTGVSRPSPPIHRYGPSERLVDLVERYWIPVWSLAQPSTQSTLQHPVCLVVVSNTYARFYGVSRGRSSVTLEGDGWAVGTMLSPAAGRLVLGRSVAEVTDTWVELGDLVPDPAVVDGVRAAMEHDPHDPAAHLAAVAHVESWLATHLPVDESGLLVNRLVAWLGDHPEVTRVDDLAREAGLSERSLQRLVEQRIGLSPKWLLQRRRLHDAVEALKAGRGSLAEVAADLGYADQAHFTHDFRTVTGMTPGEYLKDQPRASGTDPSGRLAAERDLGDGDAERGLEGGDGLVELGLARPPRPREPRDLERSAPRGAGGSPEAGDPPVDEQRREQHPVGLVPQPPVVLGRREPVAGLGVVAAQQGVELGQQAHARQVPRGRGVRQVDVRPAVRSVLLDDVQARQSLLDGLERDPGPPRDVLPRRGPVGSQVEAYDVGQRDRSGAVERAVDRLALTLPAVARGRPADQGAVGEAEVAARAGGRSVEGGGGVAGEPLVDVGAELVGGAPRRGR